MAAANLKAVPVAQPAPRPRTIVQWDLGADDRELRDDLDQYQGRRRGSRLKYLARLGLLAERQGALLEGRAYQGALILPRAGGDALLAPRGAPVAMPEATQEAQGGRGLDALMAQMEEV